MTTPTREDVPRARVEAGSPAGARPDYGIDAPGVVRNLFLAGGALFLVGIAASAGWIPSALSVPIGGASLVFPLVSTGMSAGIGFAFGGLWMWWGSRFGKLKERDELLDRVAWRGDEHVLDVGCGRGLMLVGAAARVPRGRAIGIDVWQQEDLSGNRPEVPLRNAALEGVGDRVAVETVDMRKMPFADASFDVVVSRAAIHNLYARPDRAAAIGEVARVLKPGGRALIADIRHHGEYAAAFGAGGCDVERLDSRAGSFLATLVTFGSLRPHRLLATRRKS